MIQIWFRKFTEAWSACMMVMVQGDLGVLTLSHALTASKTGSLAGTAYVLASYLPFKSTLPAVYLTGLFTMVSDIMVHPTHFGPAWMEALVTGVVAAALCLAFDKLYSHQQKGR